MYYLASGVLFTSMALSVAFQEVEGWNFDAEIVYKSLDGSGFDAKAVFTLGP